MGNNRKMIRFRDRDEWLAFRSGGIGASEVGTILGLNHFETPYQLWLRKTGQTPPQPSNTAMELGHRLEDGVAQYWAGQTGYSIIKRSAVDFMFVDADRPYFRASPDRLYWLSDTSRSEEDKGVLEVKTTQLTIDPDDLPKPWYVQLQWNMGVSRYRTGHLAWLSRGRDFGTREIEFQPDFMGWLEEEVERFWLDNVKGGREPDPVTSEDVLIKYPGENPGKTVEVGDNILDACVELRGVKERLAELDRRKKELEERIKLGFGDAEAISYGGDILATWKCSRPSGRFDAKAFAADNPELARRYTEVQKGTRRFLLR